MINKKVAVLVSSFALLTIGLLSYTIYLHNNPKVITIKGEKGDDGEDGRDGVDGINGKDGIDGKDGKDGVDGKDGLNGIDGKDGKDGKDGVDGLNGKDGKDGADGLNGKDGLNGIDGKDGKDGADGLNGKDGKDGVDGINGKDGADGKDGKDGLDGKDGADGKDGLNGKDGKNGRDGVDGEDGLPGPKGDKGEDGYSFLTGEGTPDNSLGKNGDTYLDILNFDLYKKDNNIWNKLTNLNGSSSSGSSTPTITTYSIETSVYEDTGGYISSSHDSARKDEYVIFTIDEYDGYELSSLLIYNKEDNTESNAIDINNNSYKNTGTNSIIIPFTMDDYAIDYDITVIATFAESMDYEGN